MPRIPFAALLVCCLLSTAHAQPVYKYQLPDGRIVYTSETMPNAKLLGTVREPQPPQQVDAAKQEKMKRDREAASQSGKQRSERLEAANAEVIAATNAAQRFTHQGVRQPRIGQRRAEVATPFGLKSGQALLGRVRLEAAQGLVRLPQPHAAADVMAKRHNAIHIGKIF
jgi:hypothetical protein